VTRAAVVLFTRDLRVHDQEGSAKRRAQDATSSTTTPSASSITNGPRDARPPMLEGVRSSESRAADGSIETTQCVLAGPSVVPLSEAGGKYLGRAYWSAIAGVSRGLVRVRVREEGVAIRLAGVPSPLLRLGPAEVAVEEDRVTCRFPILGGLLARRPGGALVVAQTGREPAELYVAVTGFFARLGSGAVHRHLQQRIHVAVSRRFFVRMLDRPT
jgi:hypothetical protein